MRRLESWRRYLAAAIAAAAGRAHVLGEHDCVTFAADCTQAMTGEDWMHDLRGRYGTREEGAAILDGFGGIEGLLDARLDGRWPNPSFARAGDVVTVNRLAAEVAVVAPDGAALLFIPEAGPSPLPVPLRFAETAWKAGR